MKRNNSSIFSETRNDTWYERSVRGNVSGRKNDSSFDRNIEIRKEPDSFEGRIRSGKKSVESLNRYSVLDSPSVH